MRPITFPNCPTFLQECFITTKAVKANLLGRRDAEVRRFLGGSPQIKHSVKYVELSSIHYSQKLSSVGRLVLGWEDAWERRPY